MTLVVAAQKDWTRTDIADCTQNLDGCLGMWTCPLLDIVDQKMDTRNLLFLAGQKHDDPFGNRVPVFEFGYAEQLNVPEMIPLGQHIKKILINNFS